MTMNRRACPIRIAAASLLLLSTVPATPLHALWGLAEGEVFLSLDGSIAADSNIASNALELSDTIYTLTPGISWERNRGRISMSLSANCAIERAVEYGEDFDSENYTGDFSLSMPATASGRLHGSLGLSYFEGSRVDRYLNTRLAERSFDASLDGTYQISNRTNARMGLSYGKSLPENLPDYEDTALTIGAGYQFRPAISTYVDLRFTDSSSESSGDSTNGTATSGNAILVGLDGQITRRLSGNIGVGYDWSESESQSGGSAEEINGVTYDVSLTWAPRDRTTFTLSASNGVQSTSVGRTENATVSLDATQQIGIRFSANAALSLRTSDFGSGSQGSNDTIDATVGLSYAANSYFSLTGSYSYTTADSDNAIVNYERSVWTLSGSARF